MTKRWVAMLSIVALQLFVSACAKRDGASVVLTESSLNKTNPTAAVTHSSEVKKDHLIPAEVTMDNIQDTAKQLGITNEMLIKSIVSKGNSVRVANVIRKGMRAEDITIGVIGGSVTAGTASTRGNAYANVIQEWLKSTFPESRINLINAGKGATNSMVGVHRIQPDLLSRKPDLVVVEYAVNDGSNTDIQEAYENIIRRVLKSGAAVILLFINREHGESVQDTQEKIGKHYD